jgi:hypothetical protein
MTQEQELKVVELCKQFMMVAEEVNLTFIDLCKIRDKYFPIINGRRVQNPADIAKSIQILDEHKKNLQAVLTDTMGVKFEGELVTGHKSDAKIQAAKPVAALPAAPLEVPQDAVILDQFILDYKMGGPKTKWKVRQVIAEARKTGSISKKNVEYLKKVAKGEPTDKFIATLKVE